MIQNHSILLLALLVAPAHAAQEKDALAKKADAKRFDPARCFPLECMAHLHVTSGAGLLRALGDTLPGRIVRDEEVHAALGRLPQFIREKLAEGTAHLQAITGRGILELLDLFQGEIALSVTGIDPVAKVGVVLAIELGPRREAMLDTLAKVAASLEQMGIPPLQPVEIAGRRAGRISLGGAQPPIHHAVLGTHIVFGSSADLLRSVVEAYDGAPGSEDFVLRENPRYQEAREGLKLADPRIFAFVNIEAIRNLVMMFAAQAPDAEPIVTAVKKSGIDGITVAGFAAGARGGDVEGKFLLGTGNGAKGLLGELFACVEPVADPAAVRAIAPEGATVSTTYRFDGGKAFQALVRFLREWLPPFLSKPMEKDMREALDRVGLSLEADLFAIGKIDFYVFVVDPLAGGLIPDVVVLTRTEESTPYRRLLEKTAKVQGREMRAIPGPAGPAGAAGTASTARRTIHSIPGSYLDFLALAKAGGPAVLEYYITAIVSQPSAVAYVDLDGGWTAFSTAPQPLWRYLLRAGEEKKTVVAGPAPFEADRKGADIFVTFQPRRGLLAGYNTLASVAASFAPYIEKGAAMAGLDFVGTLDLDLGLLPPAEKFLEHSKEGFLRIDAGPKGLQLHGHRVLSSTGDLWILMGAAIGAGAAAAASG